MSLGSKSGTYISNLIGIGSDVMSNLYYLEFEGNFSTDDISSQSLKVRVQEFNPPSFTQGNEEKHFMTTSVFLPTASIDGERSLSFTFRVDNNYKLYETLLKQQSLTMAGNSGWAITRVPGTTPSDNGLVISAYAFNRSLGNNPDDENNYSKLYTFKYCWIKKLDGLTYTYDNSSPVTIAANIGFMDYEDPLGLLFQS